MDGSSQSSIGRSLSGGQSRLAQHNRHALIGGIVTTGVAAAGLLIVGRPSGTEARTLLEAMQPSLRFFCSAVTTASATMLALMLTLLSLSFNIETRLQPVHYQRVRQISLLDVLAFAIAIIILLLLTSPLVESEQLPGQWYSGFYYGLVFASAILGGLIVGIMMLLYGAVDDVIDVVLAEDDSELAVTGEDQETASEGQRA